MFYTLRCLRDKQRDHREKIITKPNSVKVHHAITFKFEWPTTVAFKKFLLDIKSKYYKICMFSFSLKFYILLHMVQW